MNTPILGLLLFLSLFFQVIFAHAVLKSPTPFNTAATTLAPCGVPTITADMKSTAQVTWKAGQTANIVWNLIAGDGGGNLIGEFDPNGGTNFSKKAWTEAYPTSGSGITYSKSFVVPADLDCSGSPTGLCTFRVRTGWVSCTMVKICTSSDTTCQVTPSPPLVCSPVTSLNFCPNSTGASISQGYSATDIDAGLAYSYNSNLNNPLVFSNPASDECKTFYKNLLCSTNLPPCNPATTALSDNMACKSYCKTALSACQVTALHKTLYDCDSLPECSSAVKLLVTKAGGSNGDSSSGGMSSGGAAALSIFLIALVATVAFAGYMYHKQGHLFGYAFDKDSKRIVKTPANPHNYTAYVDNI